MDVAFLTLMEAAAGLQAFKPTVSRLTPQKKIGSLKAAHLVGTRESALKNDLAQNEKLTARERFLGCPWSAVTDLRPWLANSRFGSMTSYLSKAGLQRG